MSQIRWAAKEKGDFDHVILFMILYVTSSYYISILSAAVVVSVCLFFSLLAFATGNQTIRLRMLFYCLLLSINLLLSFLASQDIINRLMYMILSLYSALLYVSSTSKERFSKVYTDIIALVAVFSLITYMLALLAPGVVTLFPQIVNSAGFIGYNMVFSFVSFSTAIGVRNQGIFWEPGAYQTYLAFAFLLELFGRKTTRRWALCSYILSFITSQSTTGIYVMLLLILIWMLKNYKVSASGTIKLMSLLLVIMAGLYMIYPLLPENYKYAIVGKIQALLQHDGRTITTGSIRLDSIIYPLRSFLQSPIVGVGSNGLDAWSSVTGHTMYTCTPVNWFGAYGIFYGLLHSYGLYKLAKSFQSNALNTALAVGALLISLSTQQYVGNVSILLFIFYGLTSDDDLLRQPGLPHRARALYANR